MLEARTGRPVSEQQAGLFTQHTDRFVIGDDDMDSNTAKESDISLKSRSFLHRVYDRVRKILDQSSKDAKQGSNKRSLIWWMCMSSTLQASVFMVKNYLENLHSIKNTGKDLTMKQMFDISEKLIAEQSDEIYGVTPIHWERCSWKQFSLVMMNTESAKQEQRDLCWQNNLTHCLSQQVCWWKHLHLRPKILHKKIYFNSTKNEWKGSHNKIVW